MTAEEIREEATKTHSAFHIDNCNLVIIFSKPLDIGILFRCSLGDVTNSDSCYEKAQEVSAWQQVCSSTGDLNTLAFLIYSFLRSMGVCNEKLRMNSMYHCI
nr:tetratricopeptide repeat protein 27 homolog isoform X1 [Ipomoea batatas]